MRNFKTLTNEVTPKNTKLSTEMIATQIDDKVVGSLIIAYEALIKICNDNHCGNLDDLIKLRDAKRTLDELDTIIFKRFGIRTKHTGSYDMDLAITTSPPLTDGAINKNSNILYDTIDKWLADKKSSNTDMANIDVLDSEKKYNKYYETIITSMDAIEHTLNTKGVIVDLNKAVIKNLPDDYLLIIHHNYYNLIIGKKMSAEELTAAILHEIGHGFTNIEYSYRLIGNTTALVDDIIENITKKNKGTKESLLLAYKKINPESTIKDGNTITILLEVSDYLMKSYKTDPYNRSVLDAEALADQFSSRFGMGEYLVTGLTKIYGADMKACNTLSYAMWVTNIFSQLWIFILIIVLTAPILIIMILIYIFVIYVLNTILNKGGTDISIELYDKPKQRLLRIKIDAIRQLRQLSDDKNIVRKLLASIENMDNIIKLVPDEEIPLMSRVVRMMSSKARSLAEYKELDETIEKLMANDMYVNAAKIDQLKK